MLKFKLVSEQKQSTIKNKIVESLQKRAGSLSKIPKAKCAENFMFECAFHRTGSRILKTC